MAASVANSSTYQSGSGGFLNVHTMSAFDCSGTDSFLIVFSFNRNPNSDVAGFTANGNSMTEFDENINTNVSAVEGYYYAINNASFDIVCSTPSFKLAAFAAIALENVDQTGSPIVQTEKAAAGFGTSISDAITATSGELVLSAVALKSDFAMTPTGTGHTEIVDFAHADSNFGQSFVGQVAGTGSSQTIGASWSTSDNCIMMLVEIEPAAGGPAPASVTANDATHAHSADAVTNASSVDVTSAEATHAHSADAVTNSSSTDHTANDATHGHNAESVTVSVSVSITSAEATHGHTADAVTVTTTPPAANVTANDATHNHVADAVVVSLQSAITVNDGVHAHTADSVTVSSSVSVTANDATHGNATDAVTVSTSSSITANDALHAHTAESVTVVGPAAAGVTPADASHAHTADAVTVSVSSNITANDSSHNHVADAVVVSTQTAVTIDDALHTHTADAVVVSTSVNVAPDDATHAHTADSVTVASQTQTMPTDATHAHNADSVTVSTSVSVTADDSTHGHTVEAVTVITPDLAADRIFIDLIVPANIALEVRQLANIDQDIVVRNQALTVVKEDNYTINLEINKESS